MARIEAITNALFDFIECVESTGGVLLKGNDIYVPVADKDWSDLGDAYMKACDAFDRAPMVNDSW